MRLPLRAPSFRFPLLSLALCSAALAAPVLLAQMPPGVPENLDALTSQPASHLGYTFDRSQIQAAQQILESGGLPPERAIAALNSISFDTYRYKQPAFYTPEAMAGIVEAYHRAGWKHLVDGNPGPANSAMPKAALTDVWLHFSGSDIDHVTVLIRSPKDMNLIQVAGDLRPLDLLHLGGHFGIPKVDPNTVMVPAPDGR